MLANKEVILIIGGAGGIGEAILSKFYKNDASIIVADIDQRAKERLVRNYPLLSYYYIDVTRLEEIDNLYKKIEREFGYITHLISLAGRAMVEEFNGLKGLDNQKIMDSITLNLTSHIWLTNGAIPLLKASPHVNKTITLISSINALKGYGLPAYSAAKAGLIGFMHGIVAEVGIDGIRVNCVSPGTVKTPNTMKEPKDFKKYESGTVLKRLTSIDETAQVIFALTNDLTAIVGQNIIVDAGQVVNAD